jgi:hypothetical protein
MERRRATERGRVTVGVAAGLTGCLLAGLGASTAGATDTARRASVALDCPLPVFGPGSQYHPVIDPASFGPNVTNPWFPQVVGRVLVYAGVKDGKKAVDIVTASARTRVVDGVTTRVVEDRLYLDGQLEERTSDYYAQDRCGNVWYFGEDTAQLDAHGNVVDTSGSFLAGVHGAQPGVFMQARPEIGRRFRQEWARGEAEDTFRAASLGAPVTVPFGTFAHALRTTETTALEPGVLDVKAYVRGIGEVVERAARGPVERLTLVDIIDVR